MEHEIQAAISEFKNSVMGRIENAETNINLLSKDVETQVKMNARTSFSQGGGIITTEAVEHKKAFLSYMRTGREADLQRKAMASNSDPEGGYLVPDQMDTELTKYLRFRSPLRQIANVVKVESYEYKEPHSTLGTSYSWVGETASRPATTAPGFKMVSIPSFEVYSMPAITQNLLDDNIFNLENWLVEELADAFGDAEGDAFINGDGVAKPRGLFTYPTASTADATRAHTSFQYVPTGAAGAFASTFQGDALIALVYALKPQYRQNASWLLSPEFLEAVRKFKDGQGRYMWQQSTQAGQPSTLLGFPIYEEVNIPAIAANSLSAAFGDFSRAYTITDRSTSLLRDPYTSKPYVNFYCAKRLGGGGGRDTRAVKFLKFAAS